MTTVAICILRVKLVQSYIVVENRFMSFHCHENKIIIIIIIKQQPKISFTDVLCSYFRFNNICF